MIQLMEYDMDTAADLLSGTYQLRARSARAGAPEKYTGYSFDIFI